MNEIFYVDQYFAVNVLMDFVSLGIGALSASRKIPAWRLCLAALLGAALSTLAALLRLGAFWMGLASAVIFALMIALAFGIRSPRRWGKPALFSFGAAVFLGGAAQVIFYAVLPFYKARLGLGILLGAVLLGAVIYTVWANHIHRKLDTAVVSLSITYGGKCEHYFGLVDSGLLLRDPDAGRPVLLLKAEYAEPLLPGDFVRRLERGDLSETERLICVPIRSVGGRDNLFAFLPERVQVIPVGKRKKKKEERDVLVALDFSRGGYGGCPCLVPLSVL